MHAHLAYVDAFTVHGGKSELRLLIVAERAGVGRNDYATDTVGTVCMVAM